MRQVAFREKLDWKFARFLIWVQIRLKWIWILVGFPCVFYSSVKEWKKVPKKFNPSFKGFFWANWKFYLDLIEKDD